MNDFDYDVMQKKRIAASARHRVCGSKTRFVSLPSDHMTDAQLKRRNGPVSTYKLGEPMPWKGFKQLPDDLKRAYLEQLHTLGFRTVALALTPDAHSIEDPGLHRADKLALLLGTEGDGLARTTIDGCFDAVCIPMSHQVDSLNVAAASAVAFWELRYRQPPLSDV